MVKTDEGFFWREQLSVIVARRHQRRQTFIVAHQIARALAITQIVERYPGADSKNQCG